MTILDGKKVSSEIKLQLQQEISSLKSKGKKLPGLAAILVGENPASEIYVKSKSKACSVVGMHSEVVKLPSGITENELLNTIEKYNNNSNIHGILVQLPLPKNINEEKIIEAISPKKDVDGFHPYNVGNLILGKDTFVPCTPAGIQELLKYYKIETEGKHVVVVGRSNIVGKPIANLMVQKNKNANSIVTICHSASKDLSFFTKQADILIAAIGEANFIDKNMVKENSVVIDVGINRVPDPALPKGYKIVGDVDFDDVSSLVSFITPVPGGVGPMTIAMLLKNTFKAYLKFGE